MKISIPGISEILHVKEGKIIGLVVEHPGLFCDIVTDMKQQLEKRDGKIVLSIHNTVVDISRNVELVTDIFNVNLNSKAILSKLIDSLNQKALDAFYYEKTMQTIAVLQNFMDELVWDMDCEIVYENILPKQIIKALDIAIVDDEPDVAGRILRYMELIRQFMGDKLFVFVNARGFMDMKRFELFVQTIVEHGYRVIFMDNKVYPIVNCEDRLTIDIDLCEF